MKRTVPSPARASNVCFNSRWTIFLSPSRSLHCLFEEFAQKSWILCVDATIFLSFFFFFFPYIQRNLGEYLWENTLQIRSWGSDVKVSAAATILQTTIVIHAACTERWLSYNPRIPVAATNLSEQKIYFRNLRWHFERLIRALWIFTEVFSKFLDQQPA